MAKKQPGELIGMGCGALFVIAFVGIWSTVTLVFDFKIASTMYRQVRAQDFPTTSGTVVESRVETGRARGDDEIRQRARVRFAYSVDEQEYTSEQWRYETDFMSGNQSAYQIAARFREETPVRVFYNPSNPADAVLAPGIHGMDLMILMFITPFNIIMLAGWSIPVILLLSWKTAVHAAAWVVEPGVVTRIRIPDRSPLARTAGTLLLSSFAGIFVVAMTAGSNPSVRAMLFAWAVVLALTVFAYVYNSRFTGEKADLVIDRGRGVVILPQTYKRKTSVRLPLKSVKDISVAAEVGRTSRDRTMTAHVLNLVTMDGERHCLLKSHHQKSVKEAEALLNERVWPAAFAAQEVSA